MPIIINKIHNYFSFDVGHYRLQMLDIDANNGFNTRMINVLVKLVAHTCYTCVL